MPAKQAPLSGIQSHFPELGEAEQLQILKNALAHTAWFDEEARLYRVLRDGIDITDAFEIIYDAEIRKVALLLRALQTGQATTTVERQDELYTDFALQSEIAAYLFALTQQKKLNASASFVVVDKLNANVVSRKGQQGEARAKTAPQGRGTRARSQNEHTHTHTHARAHPAFWAAGARKQGRWRASAGERHAMRTRRHPSKKSFFNNLVDVTLPPGLHPKGHLRSNQVPLEL